MRSDLVNACSAHEDDATTGYGGRLANALGCHVNRVIMSIRILDAIDRNERGVIQFLRVDICADLSVPVLIQMSVSGKDKSEDLRRGPVSNV